MISKKAILFPGQGAQRPGMGAALFDAYADLLNVAEDIAGFNIRDFFIHCPPEQFNHTRYLQPALYTVNTLYYLAYLEANEPRPAFFAGHSLGEFNALQAAGAFDFVTGLHLVTKRGLLMSESKDGAMAAVLGLNSQDVVQVIVENGLSDVSIANVNAEFQIVISGPAASIQRAETIFYDNGAIKYVPLRVSGAFHSTLMNGAARQFREFLLGFTFSQLQIPVIANRTGTPYTPSSMVKNLAEHINQPVLWRQSVHYMRAQGVSQFSEMGDSTLLLDMVKNAGAPPD